MHFANHAGFVLFSIRRGRKTVSQYAIFRPFPGHAIFVCNVNFLLGVAGNAQTGTNPQS